MTAKPEVISVNNNRKTSDMKDFDKIDDDKKKKKEQSEKVEDF